MPGLFELISSKNDGAIVRSLKEGTTHFASNRSHQFSQLESIEVYTQEDNVNLSDVFEAMKGSDEKMPDTTDNKKLKAYFEKVFPAMDFDRVYTSDMKKMVKWFEILQEKEVDFSAQPEEDKEADAESEVKKPTAAEGKQEMAKTHEEEAKTATTPKDKTKPEDPASTERPEGPNPGTINPKR